MSCRHMDLVTVSFLVLGAVGAGGVILHYAGYIPKPYRDRLERTELALTRSLTELAPRVGVEVENALERIAVRQEAKYAEGVKAAEAELAKQGKSAEMSAIRHLGIDKQFAKEASQLVNGLMVGPVVSALRMAGWEDWAERLENADPRVIEMVLESRIFNEKVLPKIQPFLSQLQAKSQGSVTMTGNEWGT